MFCEVQRLYQRGHKSPSPAPAVAGELTLHKWRDGSNSSPMRLRADVMGRDRQPAVPSLIDAVVVRISAEGMVVTGTELVPRNASSKANVEYYPQTWWCRLLPRRMELLPETIQEPPKWRQAFVDPNCHS